MDDKHWGIAHRRYLRLDDYRDLYWSHTEDPVNVFAKLRTFPEGLSREEVKARRPNAAQRFPVLLNCHGEHLGVAVRRPGWTVSVLVLFFLPFLSSSVLLLMVQIRMRIHFGFHGLRFVQETLSF